MLYFLKDAFWSHSELIALFIGSLSVVIFARYVLVGILYHYTLRYIYKRSEQILKRIQLRSRTMQIRREIKWAMLSSLIFSMLCALSLLAYQKGITMIYTDIRQYSLIYFIVSPLIILVLYESYYYWLHRWMHLPGIFRVVHKVHHESLSPTVFTAFAFHPLEAFLQFIFFPVIILFIPLHIGMLALIFTLLSFFAVVNHSGIEIYKSGFRKFVIGASHHEAHHKQFRTNFGLNFTWWDRVMHTESKAVERDELQTGAAGNVIPPALRS